MPQAQVSRGEHSMGKAWSLLKVIVQPWHFPLSGQLKEMPSYMFLYFQVRNIKALLHGA